MKENIKSFIKPSLDEFCRYVESHGFDLNPYELYKEFDSAGWRNRKGEITKSWFALVAAKNSIICRQRENDKIMAPKRIYIRRKSADSVDEYGAVTINVKNHRNDSVEEVCYMKADSLWHGTEEKPCKDKYFVVKKHDGRLLTLRIHEKTNWEKFFQWYKINTWAYVEDLLP